MVVENNGLVGSRGVTSAVSYQVKSSLCDFRLPLLYPLFKLFGHSRSCELKSRSNNAHTKHSIEVRGGEGNSACCPALIEDDRRVQSTVIQAGISPGSRERASLGGTTFLLGCWAQHRVSFNGHPSSVQRIGVLAMAEETGRGVRKPLAGELRRTVPAAPSHASQGVYLPRPASKPLLASFGLLAMGRVG